ncbi:hypothetical protein LOD99_1194 [Oopsacas minuta]|uniref:UBA domain-containing protein n=1 Tax=Oopsacas minuta TaxID=111878 RepID=A0AAV7K6W7_9METZ|nr:hypothetical protein LOD99_1194 [Oopsacas minuta]
MSVILKVYYVESDELEPTEIRRFLWQLSGLKELLEKISNIFSVQLEPELITLYNTGVSGEKLYLKSDLDLETVFEQAPRQSTLKLWVTRNEPLECEPKVISSSIREDYVTQSSEEIESDFLGSRNEFDSLQTSSSIPKPEPTNEFGTIDLIKSQKKISEGLLRADSESSKLDARFNTSYGKSSFSSTFAQIAKDFGACFSPCGSGQTTPSFTDLPPQFVESLCTLREMGFDVENPNVLKILRRNNGELEQTLTEVMDSGIDC